MKKAIVIGGSGFLGSELLNVLSVENIEVLAVVNKSMPVVTKNQNTLTGGIEAVSSSVLNDFQPDVIFHCARPTLPRLRKFGRILAARKAYKLNKKLIHNIHHSESKPTLVFASGSLMYGNSSIPHYESSPLNPVSYAKQYFKGEQPLLDAMHQNKLNVSILRFPWLLGNGSWFKWFYLESVKKQNLIPVFGSGENLMEIIDVKDAARLMKLYAAKNPEPGVYNISSGKPVSQVNFVEEVANVFHGKIVDYKSIFPKGIEKEAIEAFTSNITLKSKHTTILDTFGFTSLHESLVGIKKESGEN